MNVSRVRFGSYLTYAPWGTETCHYEYKSVKRDLKEYRVIKTGQIFSEWIVGEIEHTPPYLQAMHQDGSTLQGCNHDFDVVLTYEIHA